MITIAGKTSRQAKAAVFKMLRDSDAEVRVIASMWLRDIGISPMSDEEESAAAIGAAIGALADPRADVRRYAAEALGTFSAAGDLKVMRALERQLEDQDWSARRAASEALEKILSNDKDRTTLP